MPPMFEASTAQGLIVGYGLLQDDEVDVEIHVGRPFTKKQLAKGRWLEPQTAFLRLPTGRLRVESNDASRVGPEEPGEEGVTVQIAPGDYRLTLLRADHEALDREGIEWAGPQELILLQAGGTRADAADEILPFEPRRDLAFVGRHTIDGARADALVWFDDGWDSFHINLDAAALETMGLRHGGYIRTLVPDVGLTLVTAYHTSWSEGKHLPPPRDVPLDEYGYGSVIVPQDWMPAQTLFCKRESAKARVEDRHHNTWIPAVVEVLDPSRHAPQEWVDEISPIELGEQTYFDDSFLAMVLFEVLPEVEDLDELPLADALERFDELLAEGGLEPRGDVRWRGGDGLRDLELGVRLYTGIPDAFAAIMVARSTFEVVLISEVEDGRWVVTGHADDLDTRIMRVGKGGVPVAHPVVALTLVGAPVDEILAAHVEAVARERVLAAPASLDETVAAFRRLMAVAR